MREAILQSLANPGVARWSVSSGTRTSPSFERSSIQLVQLIGRETGAGGGVGVQRQPPRVIWFEGGPAGERAIGTLLPNNKHQHRALHIQMDVLPCALC